jgi:molybdopterin-guanine dinucleotide biosynthesis protein A
MGGVAKANLLVGGRSILERTVEQCHAAARVVWGDEATLELWLVGDSAAYRAPGLLRVADDPAGIGPIGGLRAFLRQLLPEQQPALVLAGDLPFLSVELLARLLRESPGAAALAPRDGEGRWQPLFARYSPGALLPEIDAALLSGRTSLQHLFERLRERAVQLPLSQAEWLAVRDWDRPSDMAAECPETPG